MFTSQLIYKLCLFSFNRFNRISILGDLGRGFRQNSITEYAFFKILTYFYHYSYYFSLPVHRSFYYCYIQYLEPSHETPHSQVPMEVLGRVVVIDHTLTAEKPFAPSRYSENNFSKLKSN